MSKVLYASTSITIERGSDSEEFINVESMDKSTTDKKYFKVTSHNLRKLQYEGHDCSITKKGVNEYDNVETVTVTDGTVDLAHKPVRIKDIEVITKSSGFSTTATLNGKTLVFSSGNSGEVAILQISYTYKAEEIYLEYHKSSGASVSMFSYGTAGANFKPEVKAILVATCDTQRSVSDVTFTYTAPTLTEEKTIEGKVATIKIYTTYLPNLDSLQFIWDGGTVKSTYFGTESITESISIEGGYGTTSKAIFALESYEFITGAGSITKFNESNVDNKVVFYPSGSYNDNSGFVNITYQAKFKVYECEVLNTSGKYKVTDSFGNTLSGVVDVEDTQNNDVDIFIKDYLTKEFVSGALVEINGKRGYTDANGKVTFYNIPVGRHLVKVTKQGYIVNTLDNLNNEWITVNVRATDSA